MDATIYHNPKCGTSRNTLAMMQQAGLVPTVIEYLKAPPTRDRLVELIAMIGLPVREIMRRKGTPYDELGLDDPKWSDDDLVDFMIKHPILINRPIVVVDAKARLCRPSETLFELITNPGINTFTKEDGEVVKAPKSHDGQSG